MANLVNVQLARHCNEFERIAGDKFSSLGNFVAVAIADYEAKNLGTIIDSGGAGNTILDGSETDGRTLVVGGDVYNMQTLLADFVTFLNVGNRRDVISKWRVNVPQV